VIAEPLKEDLVFDLAIDLGGRPDALAVLGETLGRAGISIEGGGMFTVEGTAIAHFLVGDGQAARSALAAAGISVTDVREVVACRLDQETPGQLGAIIRAIAEAGVRVDVLYSDHDHRLILVTSDQPVTATVTKAWDR
jgi:hypothetical protein